MKKIIIYAVFSINFLLAFSQEEKAGIIAKNKSGNISSVEFSAEKDKVPSSATDFFEMYLRT